MTTDVRALAASGLTQSFSVRRAIDGLNQNLHHDEVLAIVGVSGSGDCPFLYIMTGLRQPEKDSVAWVKHAYAAPGSKSVFFARTLAGTEKCLLTPDRPGNGKFAAMRPEAVRENERAVGPLLRSHLGIAL